jgi:quinol monooxygenase YgiN
MTIIVAGTMEFDPDKVEAALTSAREHIAGAYTEKGCIHYAWTPDLLNPGRIYVFEEWETQEDFANHLASHWYRDMGAHIRTHGVKAASVKKYRVDLSEPVYDPKGVPRADFFTAA